MPAMSSAFPIEARARPQVRRVILRDFRSYAALDIAFDGAIVVLCGENGAGKTNFIEALSLFAPGRGLRRADMADCARVGGPGGFAASVTIEEAPGAERQLGLGFEDGARQYRVERAPVASARAFADYVRIVWLTPSMDGLFLGPAGERRRFLDRLVLAIDPGHGARVAQFERALRGRNKLLEAGGRNGQWLEAIEHEAAQIAVAIAAARVECVARLKAIVVRERDDDSPFPWADISLAGEVESLAMSHPALAAEDRYRALLRDNRARDAAAGRTLIGPHVADLLAFHLSLIHI